MPLRYCIPTHVVGKTNQNRRRCQNRLPFFIEGVYNREQPNSFGVFIGYVKYQEEFKEKVEA